MAKAALGLVISTSLLLAGCGGSGDQPEPEAPDEDAAQVQTALPAFTALPLPDGHGFPTPDNQTILNWIDRGDYANIYGHTWGLWTALTLPSGEMYTPTPNPPENLRYFETWFSAFDVFDSGTSADGSARSRGNFHNPRQLAHGSLPPQDFGGEALAFVKYNPTAAQHIWDNGYNKKANITGDKIKKFPRRSVALKPTWWRVAQTGLTAIPYWPGPPPKVTPELKANGYGNSKWPDCVLVDPTNQQGGTTTSGTCNGHTQDWTVVNIDDFIHSRLGQAEIDQLSTLEQSADNWTGATVGDFAVLMAMHVTSKEIDRWTWETFWWSHNPDDPHFPSSQDMANARPADLTGAPRHYAGCAGYSMVLPRQDPNTGSDQCTASDVLTENPKGCLYCYNPYLEAPFNAEVTAQAVTPGGNGKIGMQTGCMSCHAGAGEPAGIPYTGDTYQSMEPGTGHWAGQTQVDFLWSIQANAK